MVKTMINQYLQNNLHMINKKYAEARPGEYSSRDLGSLVNAIGNTADMMRFIVKQHLPVFFCYIAFLKLFVIR